MDWRISSIERGLVQKTGRPARISSADDVGLEVGEGQDQVGLEGEDPVGPEGREAADPGLVARLGRPLRGAGHADHAVPRPERVADLHVLGAQADDALGEGYR